MVDTPGGGGAMASYAGEIFVGGVPTLGDGNSEVGAVRA